MLIGLFTKLSEKPLLTGAQFGDFSLHASKTAQ